MDASTQTDTRLLADLVALAFGRNDAAVNSLAESDRIFVAALRTRLPSNPVEAAVGVEGPSAPTTGTGAPTCFVEKIDIDSSAVATPADIAIAAAPAPTLGATLRMSSSPSLSATPVSSAPRKKVSSPPCAPSKLTHGGVEAALAAPVTVRPKDLERPIGHRLQQFVEAATSPARDGSASTGVHEHTDGTVDNKEGDSSFPPPMRSSISIESGLVARHIQDAEERLRAPTSPTSDESFSLSSISLAATASAASTLPHSHSKSKSRRPKSLVHPRTHALKSSYPAPRKSAGAAVSQRSDSESSTRDLANHIADLAMTGRRRANSDPCLTMSMSLLDIDSVQSDAQGDDEESDDETVGDTNANTNTNDNNTDTDGATTTTTANATNVTTNTTYSRHSTSHRHHHVNYPRKGHHAASTPRPSPHHNTSKVHHHRYRVLYGSSHLYGPSVGSRLYQRSSAPVTTRQSPMPSVSDDAFQRFSQQMLAALMLPVSQRHPALRRRVSDPTLFDSVVAMRETAARQGKTTSHNEASSEHGDEYDEEEGEYTSDEEGDTGDDTDEVGELDHLRSLGSFARVRELRDALEIEGRFRRPDDEEGNEKEGREEEEEEGEEEEGEEGVAGKTKQSMKRADESDMSLQIRRRASFLSGDVGDDATADDMYIGGTEEGARSIPMGPSLRQTLKALVKILHPSEVCRMIVELADERVGSGPLSELRHCLALVASRENTENMAVFVVDVRQPKEEAETKTTAEGDEVVDGGVPTTLLAPPASLGASSGASSVVTLGVVLPISKKMDVKLLGNGTFALEYANREYIFKTSSVRSMWSTVAALRDGVSVAQRMGSGGGGAPLTDTKWLAPYQTLCQASKSKNRTSFGIDLLAFGGAIESSMAARQALAGGSAAAGEEVPEGLPPKGAVALQLREVMRSVDLDNVTSKQVRESLETHFGVRLSHFKRFIDEEMMTVLGQMDASSQIFDFLYLGSEWNASNKAELDRNGVRAVLNMAIEILEFYPDDYEYLHVNIHDEPSEDILRHLDSTYRFIKGARERQMNVFVHCKMGVSRSATAVIAFAMKEFGWSLDEALAHAKRRRAIVHPNRGFMQQLREYEGILRAARNYEVFASGGAVRLDAGAAVATAAVIALNQPGSPRIRKKTAAKKKEEKSDGGGTAVVRDESLETEKDKRGEEENAKSGGGAAAVRDESQETEKDKREEEENAKSGGGADGEEGK